jgi:signal transduction histidine kinase
VAPADPLLRFIRCNLLAAVASVGLLVGVYVGVVQSGWLVALIAAVTLVSVTLAYAHHEALAGRRSRAVGLTGAASLVVSPFVVAVVPDVLAPLALVCLLQLVLATDFFSPRQFALVVGGSLVTLTATAIAGRTSGVRSLIEKAPDRLLDVVVVVAVPTVAALVALLVWQHRQRLAGQADELRRSRARLTSAADRERRRLERDLHDGAQQQLIAATVQLPTVRTLIQQGRAEDAAVLVDRVEQRLRGALDDLRQLARGLYPPVLASRGLAEALGEATGLLANPTVVRLAPVPRLAPEVETAVYYCCLEALQNASKHGGAGTTITVDLAQRGGAVVFCVADDGPGFEQRGAGDGSGLVNMADRISAAGGTLAITTAPGRGTTVAGQVPVGPVPVSS